MIFKNIEVNEHIKNYNLRTFEKKDIHKLVSLFEEVFNRKYGSDYWNWKYFQNPYGTAIGLGLWYKEELIGHYCADRKVFKYKEGEFNCALVTTAVSHKDYRRQGIFSYLAKNIYNKLSEMGFLFLFGFPNPLYPYEIYIKKLEWNLCEQKLILIKNLKKEINQNNNLVKHQKYIISKIEKYPEIINSIDKSEVFGLNSKIDSDYLNWRYVNHPINKYSNFIVYDFNDKICGFFVVKTYLNKNNEKFGEINDIKIFKRDLNILHEIYHFLSNLFPTKEYDYLSTWIGKNSKLFEFFLKNKFKIARMETSWGFKLLQNLSPKRKKEISNPRNWNLRMGDSDVY